MGRSRTEPIRRNGEKSSFCRGNTPTLIPLVADAGVEREHVFTGIRKAAAVRLTDLADIRHLIGARSQLGRQRDFITDVQRVDLPEVAVGAAVMGCKADVALPDGGVLKMPDTFSKRLAVRSLINSNAQIQRGDLDLTERAVSVVEVARHLREQRGGLIAAADRAPRRNDIAAAADHGAGRGKGARREIRRQVLAGMERVHALRAKGGRNERGIRNQVSYAECQTAETLGTMRVPAEFKLNNVACSILLFFPISTG